MSIYNYYFLCHNFFHYFPFFILPTPPQVFLAKVDIRIDKRTTFICISPENTEYPIYRIDNLTKGVTLLLRQKGFEIVDYVYGGESVPYAWDEPAESSQTLMVCFFFLFFFLVGFFGFGLFSFYFVILPIHINFY